MAKNEAMPRFDVSGYDVITKAIWDLLNDFPGLEGKEIAFAKIGDSSGIAVYPITSAVIMDEQTNVMGKVKQVCCYPFTIVYRAGGLSEVNKANVKEWLDNLGRWLERQAVNIGGQEHRLDKYPKLTNGAVIKRFDRQTPGFLESIEENKSENWTIQITMTYTNEFRR